MITCIHTLGENYRKGYRKVKALRQKEKVIGCRFLVKAAVMIFFSAVSLQTIQAEDRRANNSAIITGKVFPFYEYIARNRSFAEVVKKDGELLRQNRQQIMRIQKALQQCENVTCYADAVQWNSEEIAAIGKRLQHLSVENKNLRPLPGVIRAGEHYRLFDGESDKALVVRAWNDAALGANRILDVYIKGKNPRYPAIDSISFPAGDTAFRQKVRSELSDLVKRQSSNVLFFQLPLQFALAALALNERDEAARYEPLNQGMNKAVVEHIPKISWTSYAYSLILVPGQGPELPGVSIDPMSVNRCRLAAERYRKGLAPLIVVSGGHVHPNKTPYSEAIEMKKYMVKELGIPENVILIEPHARHTTTNLRNTARMVFRFGIPDAMKILTVSDPVQSSYIPKMEKRFLDELGYVPYRDMKVLSAEENEFYPIRNALQANSLDPLDP
jgi:hypothetical protein